MLPESQPDPGPDPPGAREPLRLWFAELAIALFEGYRGFATPDDARSWAAEDAEDTYRIILGTTLDVDDLKDRPDPQCVQSHLPPGRRPRREEIQEAIRRCRK